MGVAGMPVAVLLGRWYLQQLGTSGIEHRLESLCAQVIAWQAAHDHQVESIDRRMRDLESSAARAENEARMVSVQLTDMSRSLAGRLEQVEHRLERGIPGRGGSCSVMAAAHPYVPSGRHIGIGAEAGR
jgi:hypothetical protein